MGAYVDMGTEDDERSQYEEGRHGRPGECNAK